MVKSAVEAFIDDHGAAKVAEAAGKTIPAVRLWRHRHIIPRDAWPELIEGIEGLSIAQLKEIEALAAPFATRAAEKRKASA